MKFIPKITYFSKLNDKIFVPQIFRLYGIIHMSYIATQEQVLNNVLIMCTIIPMLAKKYMHSYICTSTTSYVCQIPYGGKLWQGEMLAN